MKFADANMDQDNEDAESCEIEEDYESDVSTHHVYKNQKYFA